MIRTTLYAILLAFIIVFAALACGLLIVRTMIAILDYFDEEEESESYEESSTTEEPSTTTLPPTLKEWINEEPLQAPPYKPLSTEEKIRNLESEIIRIWDYILKIR